MAWQRCTVRSSINLVWSSLPFLKVPSRTVVLQRRSQSKLWDERSKERRKENYVREGENSSPTYNFAFPSLCGPGSWELGHGIPLVPVWFKLVARASGSCLPVAHSLGRSASFVSRTFPWGQVDVFGRTRTRHDTLQIQIPDAELPIIF